jgi:hypothetical protein
MKLPKYVPLPDKIIDLQRPLEFFKSYDLHNIYGEEYINNSKTFDATTAEAMCVDIFSHMRKLTGYRSNRGDFVCSGKYFDQKTAQVVHKLPTGSGGTYFKVKYSNVNAKMFIQIVFKELDLIIQDLKELGKWKIDEHARLINIRYKTEMTFEDMWYIDEEIIKGDNVKSFCGRNKIPFLWFINDLCTYNVRKFSHLIIFHPPANSEQDYKFEKNGSSYTTYKNHINYMITPININQVNIFVDYIGFGGFKIYVPFKKTEEKDIMKYPEVMNEHIKELDEAINVSLSINNYRDVWNETPWKPSWNWKPTDNWVEKYKEVDIKEEYWEEYQENV